VATGPSSDGAGPATRHAHRRAPAAAPRRGCARRGFAQCGCVVALTAALALGGCGRSDTGTDPGAEAVAEARTGAADTFSFVDIAPAAGIDIVNVSGDPRRWYIPESNGNGAAWLDFDGDGDMDLYVGNGAGMTYHEDGRRLEVVRTASSRLYRNDGRAPGGASGGVVRFTDVTAETGAGRSDWINAVSVGDADNDGDPDLYLACFGEDVYLRNDGGRFTDATSEAGLGNALWGAGAAFGDADGDGWLDLYVANYVHFDPARPPNEGRRHVIDGVEVGLGPEAENGLGVNTGAPDRFWRNDGTGRFVESAAAAGLQLERPLCSYAVVFCDVDADGDADLLVANDMQPSNLFINRGDGTFTEEGELRGFAFDANGRATSAMGLAVEDVDGDGDMDVLRTNFDFEPNSLHLNDGRGFFTERAAACGLAEPSTNVLGWGAAFLDAENDGDLDLVVANGHVYPQAERIGMNGWLMPTQLFEALGIVAADDAAGGGLPRWRDATASAGPDLGAPRSARGLAVADMDDDGDPDLLIVDMDGPPRLLENRSATQGRWIAVRTIGRAGQAGRAGDTSQGVAASGDSNRDGYGARVSVRAGDRVWTREVRATQGLYSSHDPRLLFGLGPVDGVDSVEVLWPGGRRSVVEHPPLDALLIVEEPEGRQP
jgi:hypothetical protein